MTFEEIGKELGITRKAAHIYYKNALKKLRNRPHTMERLAALAEEKHRRRKVGHSNAIKLEAD